MAHKPSRPVRSNRGNYSNAFHTDKDEGDATVASDRIRLVALFKRALKRAHGRRFLCRLEGFTQKNVPGGVAAQRQGVTIMSVAKLELAFEVEVP